MELIKYQTQNYKIANGSLSGTYEKEVTLETGYDICDAVGVHEITNGGTAFYRIGLKDQSANLIQDLTHKNDFLVSTSVAPKDRMKPMNIPADGRKVKIMIYIPTILTSDLEIDSVFRLVKVK